VSPETTEGTPGGGTEFPSPASPLLPPSRGAEFPPPGFAGSPPCSGPFRSPPAPPHGLMDRKFDSRRFDAERVVGLATRISTGTERLSSDLTSTLEQTLAPAAVGIWI
jgi:hypothetical protein